MAELTEVVSTVLPEPALTFVRTARPSVVFACSAVAGIVVSAVIIVLSVSSSRSAWGQLFSHPGHTFAATGDTLSLAYSSLLTGALGKPTAFSTAFSHSSLLNWELAFQPLGSTITTSVPLAISGMGLAIAYRSGVFNIGAAAQLICGGVLASWVGFSLAGLAMPLHVALGLLAAAAGGAIGGLVPGILKVRTGANEVIVTIMLNSVMGSVLVWLISNTFFSQLAGATPVGQLTTPSGSLPHLFGRVTSIDAGVLVAAVALVFGWVLLTRSRLGFELELSGSSPGAARLAGVRQARVFVLAFCISGAVVGLAGGVEILGVQHQLQSTFGSDIGVLAITVAFVGRNRPLGIMLAALLYGVLQNGGLNLQGATGLSFQLSTVVEAVLVAMAADAGGRHIVIVLGVGGINAAPIVDPRVGAVCAVAAVLAAAGIVAVVLTRSQPVNRLVMRVSVGVALLGTLLGYLAWSPQGSRLSLSNIVVAALGGATPLLLGSTAGVISERAGIINITIEGEFLASACAAAVVATVTHSPWLGLLVGASPARSSAAPWRCSPSATSSTRSSPA